LTAFLILQHFLCSNRALSAKAVLLRDGTNECVVSDYGLDRGFERGDRRLVRNMEKERSRKKQIFLLCHIFTQSHFSPFSCFPSTEMDES
jgi:hypothetical protein